MPEANHNSEVNISLGRWLKSAREQRGESLENASAITRISKSYLQAIEEDRLEKLPSPAYTRGFIRLYASHLGLSSEEISLHTGPNLSSEAESSSFDRTIDSRSRSFSVYLKSKKWILALLILLAVVFFAILPLLQNSRSREREQKVITPPHSSPLEKQPSSTSPPMEPYGAKPVDLPTEPPVSRRENPAVTGLILRLKAVQDGRIHITIDDSISQEYELKNGDIIEWKADKMLLLELDNAGSVEGELNGSRMNAFGEPGKPAHLTLRAESIEQQ